MSRMKIVISTFNNSKNNYGALFQACGLNSFLSELKYDVSNVTLEQRKPRNRHFKDVLKLYIKKIVLMPHAKKFAIREKKFRQFAKDTQNQITYQTTADLYANPPIADIYLSGSDQVWNPISMYEDLFLAYAPKGSRKISYAASMGNEIIPSEKRARFAELIGEYDAFSVREDTVVGIIGQFTDKPVYQHIDPVFLKSREEWERLETPYERIRLEKYILAYVIEWNSDYNKQLKELKKQTGLPVVSINIGNVKRVCADQIIYDASPSEFLYLLHHSELVVATSFHGIAMAIIYNKPFLSYAGNNMPTRIQSLIRHFRIDPDKSHTYGFDDFREVNEIIVKDQNNAEDYFRKNIDG